MYIHVSGKGRTAPWFQADKGTADVFRIHRYDMYATPWASVNVMVSLNDWFSQYAPGQTSIKAVCSIVDIREKGGRYFPVIEPILPIQAFQAFGVDSPSNGLMQFANRIIAELQSRRYAISPEEFSSLVNQKVGRGAVDNFAVMTDFVKWLLRRGMSVDDIISASKRPVVLPGDTCGFGPRTILGDALDPNSFAGKTYFIELKWSNGEVQLADVADVVELYQAGRMDTNITMTELDGGLVVFNDKRGGYYGEH